MPKNTPPASIHATVPQDPAAPVSYASAPMYGKSAIETALDEYHQMKMAALSQNLPQGTDLNLFDEEVEPAHMDPDSLQALAKKIKEDFVKKLVSDTAKMTMGVDFSQGAKVEFLQPTHVTLMLISATFTPVDQMYEISGHPVDEATGKTLVNATLHAVVPQEYMPEHVDWSIPVKIPYKWVVNTTVATEKPPVIPSYDFLGKAPAPKSDYALRYVFRYQGMEYNEVEMMDLTYDDCVNMISDASGMVANGWSIRLTMIQGKKRKTFLGHPKNLMGWLADQQW